MAKRQRNYHAKSNKGKGWEVFAHNVGSDIEKHYRDSQKAREKASREIAKDRAKKEKEADKRRQQLARESNNREKERQKQLKAQIVANKRFQKFVQKAESQCEKYGVDVVCARAIAKAAYNKGVSLNQVGTLVIKDKENEWNALAPEIHKKNYRSHVEHILQDYINQEIIHHYYLEELFSTIVENHIDPTDLEKTDLLSLYIHKSKNRFVYEENIKKLCEKAVEKGHVLEILLKHYYECFQKSPEIKLANFADSECYKIYKKVSEDAINKVNEQLEKYLK